VPLQDLQALADPSRFTGRAPQQVDDFLGEVIEPLLATHAVRTANDEVRV